MRGAAWQYVSVGRVLDLRMCDGPTDGSSDARFDGTSVIDRYGGEKWACPLTRGGTLRWKLLNSLRTRDVVSAGCKPSGLRAPRVVVSSLTLII
jgi:hypothetical protein